MNCFDFRRASLENPQQLSALVAEHLHICTDCLGFHQALLAQEQRLEAVLNIPVADELGARIKLQQSLIANGAALKPAVSQPVLRTARKWWMSAALAASLTAVSAGLIYLQNDYLQADTAELLVQHLQEEAHALMPKQAVEDGKIDMVLANVNLAQLEGLSNLNAQVVSFAGNCIVEGQLAAHLVVQSDMGAITVLLMPNNQLRHLDERMSGPWNVAVASMGEGTMALIGPEGQSLSALSAQLQAIFDA